ncbi:unnamed protein product [Effrenium voratum]|nr:unnamed protein product [Effrenium voratum]CAJ1461272.1 unnamed protein product [Effrenium voratum]
MELVAGTQGQRHLVPLLLLPAAASALLEAAGDLEVELSWGQPAAAATLDLWLPFSAGAAALLKELAPAAGQLGDALQVRPHWRVVALDPAETAGAGAARRCARGLSELCADSETGTAEDLEQAVRLHCVARRHPKLWWQYVESESALSAAQAASVERCVAQEALSLLEDDREAMSWGASDAVAVRINGWRYSGPVQAQTLLQTLCRHISPSPAACEPFLDKDPHPPAGLPAWTLLGLCGVSALLGRSFRRSLRWALGRCLRKDKRL